MITFSSPFPVLRGVTAAAMSEGGGKKAAKSKAKASKAAEEVKDATFDINCYVLEWRTIESELLKIDVNRTHGQVYLFPHCCFAFCVAVIQEKGKGLIECFCT